MGCNIWDNSFTYTSKPISYILYYTTFLPHPNFFGQIMRMRDKRVDHLWISAYEPDVNLHCSRFFGINFFGYCSNVLYYIKHLIYVQILVNLIILSFLLTYVGLYISICTYLLLFGTCEIRVDSIFFQYHFICSVFFFSTPIQWHQFNYFLFSTDLCTLRQVHTNSGFIQYF